MWLCRKPAPEEEVRRKEIDTGVLEDSPSSLILGDSTDNLLEFVNSLDHKLKGDQVENGVEDSPLELVQAVVSKLEKQMEETEDIEFEAKLRAMRCFLRCSAIKSKDFIPGRGEGMACLYDHCNVFFTDEKDDFSISSCALLSQWTYEVPKKLSERLQKNCHDGDVYWKHANSSLLRLMSHMGIYGMSAFVRVIGICLNWRTCCVEKPLGEAPLFVFDSRGLEKMSLKPSLPLKKRIFVAVQGCSSLGHWPTTHNRELVALPNRWTELLSAESDQHECEALLEARVHKAFLSIFEGHMKEGNICTTAKGSFLQVCHSLPNLLKQFFTKEEQNGQVVFTGHGLGAPVAVLHAISHALNCPKASTKVVTFGCPAFGNEAFAGLVNHTVEHVRLFLNDDPVAAVSERGEGGFTEAVYSLFDDVNNKLKEKNEVAREEEKLIHGAASHVRLCPQYAVLTSDAEEPKLSAIKRPFFHLSDVSVRSEQVHLLLLASTHHNIDSYMNALTHPIPPRSGERAAHCDSYFT